MWFDFRDIEAGDLPPKHIVNASGVPHARAVGTFPPPPAAQAWGIRYWLTLASTVEEDRVVRGREGLRKWFLSLFGLAYLLGYLVARLLSGREFTWGGLLVAILVAGGVAISVTLLHGRSARSLVVAALCVTAAALTYVLLIGFEVSIVVILLGSWGMLASLAISGREERA